MAGRLKITPEDYSRLKALYTATLQGAGGAVNAWEGYKLRNLSRTRFLFDVYHTTVDRAQNRYYQDKTGTGAGDYLFLRRLYDYLGDDNLESAFKAIYQEVTSCKS